MSLLCIELNEFLNKQKLLYFEWIAIIIYSTFILCAVGCILIMPGFPIDCVFVLLLCRKRIGIWIIVLNTKETLPKFFSRKFACARLLGDLSPMRRSQLGLGRDSYYDPVWIIGLSSYYYLIFLSTSLQCRQNFAKFSNQFICVCNLLC